MAQRVAKLSTYTTLFFVIGAMFVVSAATFAYCQKAVETAFTLNRSQVVGSPSTFWLPDVNPLATGPELGAWLKALGAEGREAYVTCCLVDMVLMTPCYTLLLCMALARVFTWGRSDTSAAASSLVLLPLLGAVLDLMETGSMCYLANLGPSGLSSFVDPPALLELVPFFTKAKFAVLGGCIVLLQTVVAMFFCRGGEQTSKAKVN